MNKIIEFNKVMFDFYWEGHLEDAKVELCPEGLESFLDKVEVVIPEYTTKLYIELLDKPLKDTWELTQKIDSDFFGDPQIQYFLDSHSISDLDEDLLDYLDSWFRDYTKCFVRIYYGWDEWECWYK